MPIALKRWCLDPLTFEECLRYEQGKGPERAIVPRKLKQLERLIAGICYVQGSYLVTGYRGVGKTSFVNYALAKAYKQLADQKPPCILVPVFLNLARSYDVGKLLRRTIRQLYRVLAETQIEVAIGEGPQKITVYTALSPDLQRELTNAYFKTSARISEATTDALKTVIAEATTREWNVGGEVSGEYSLLPDPLPAKVGAKLAGGYSVAKSSSRSEEKARETVNSLEYLEYDDEIAEDELMRLIERLADKPVELQWEERQQVDRRPRWFWKVWGRIRRRDYLTRSVPCKDTRRLQLVFVYDELDKVEPQEAQKMLSTLKPVLLSSKATLIFVGGYEFAHQWLARTQPEGDLLYGLFNDVIYVPLYTDEELDQLARKLCEMPLEDDERESFQAILDHVKLHCGGTPRGFFRQFLEFVQWEEGRLVLDRCQEETLFSRLLPYVQQVNSRISGSLPEQARDELIRCTYQWLMIAEREATFSLNSLFQISGARTEDKGREIEGGVWKKALSDHFDNFCDAMLTGGIFQPIESSTEELYSFNPSFSLGTWVRRTGIPSPPEGTRVSVLPTGPFEAPPETAYFVDREVELRTVRQALESGVPIVQIVGMAGVGKTALAIRIAHEMRDRFPDGVLWIGLEPATTLENVLHHIALSYGEVLADAESEALAAKVRALLTDKKALVVLDAAENLSGDDIKQAIPGTRNSSVMLTTRRRFPELEHLGHTLVIDVLPDEYSFALLRHLAGYQRVSAEKDKALEICRRLGYHPLAIEIAGRLARSQGWSIQSLLEILKSSVLDLSEADPLAPVTQALSASYETLHDEEKRALMAASVFEGDFDVTGLAYVLNAQQKGPVIYLLDNLLNRSLVVRSADQSYRLHPLIRAYIRRVADPQLLQEMHRRHAVYFLKWIRAEKRGEL